MARVIEDVRAPLGVVAESRIFVLVARSAVKSPQGPIVLGEMRRHPVQQHANARLMQRINKETEIVGRTVSRCGRKVSAHLIPPGSAVRMLQYGQQFHVGESQLRHVVGQQRGQLAIVQESTAVALSP